MIKIYGLYDPRDPERIRYVGKTRMTTRKRLQGHIDESRLGKSKTYKVFWIRKLLKENIRPLIKVLELCDEKDWQEREKYWIAKLNNLTNSTEGGDTTAINNESPVVKYSKYGKLICFYESIENASHENKIERGVINSALQRNPEGGFGGGFIWRYANLEHMNFVPPYIDPKSKAIRIIDIEEEKSYLFESIKDGLEFFKFKRCGNINKCINNMIPLYNRYYIMQIN